MMKIEKTVNQITVENVVNVIENENVTFGEILIESYEYDYNENNQCVLKTANIVIPVYTNDDENVIMFTMNLENTVCDESEIDDKLYELLESKIDNEIMQ